MANSSFYRVLLVIGVLHTVTGLQFANSYGDHMVLQRAPQQAIIWGYSDVIGDTLSILKNAVAEGSTIVKRNPNQGPEGIWQFKLSPESHPGPYTIQVSSASNGTTISINDVMFGDVWVCSGQSNMQFTMKEVNNSVFEINDSLNYPDIRMIYTKLAPSTTPTSDVKVNQPWEKPMKGFIEKFSALCYMFGRDLYKELKYPIGLVESNWGGTPIEVWSSPDAIAKCPNQGQGPRPSIYWPTTPSSLWNSMIYPYLKSTIKGAIWYQGEANSGNPDLYACQFPAMINDWRDKFNNASEGETSIDFPFGFVQLAPNRNITGVGGFPPTRWAQTADVGYVPNSKMPNTFMAVAVDLPDFKSPSGSIHPRYKQDLADRLSRGALNLVYENKLTPFQGPFPTDYTLNNAELKITFDNGQANLHLNNLKGFEVCCESSATSKCPTNTPWQAAPILSYQPSSVSVDVTVCANGKQVAGVRYLWSESPCQLKQCALYSERDQLPVPPFIKTGGFTRTIRRRGRKWKKNKGGSGRRVHKNGSQRKKKKVGVGRTLQQKGIQGKQNSTGQGRTLQQKGAKGKQRPTGPGRTLQQKRIQGKQMPTVQSRILQQKGVKGKQNTTDQGRTLQQKGIQGKQKPTGQGRTLQQKVIQGKQKTTSQGRNLQQKDIKGKQKPAGQGRTLQQKSIKEKQKTMGRGRNLKQKGKQKKMGQGRNLKQKGIKGKQKTMGRGRNLKQKGKRGKQKKMGQGRNMKQKGIKGKQKKMGQGRNLKQKGIKGKQKKMGRGRNLKQKGIKEKQKKMGQGRNLKQKGIKGKQKKMGQGRNLKQKGIKGKQKKMGQGRNLQQKGIKGKQKTIGHGRNLKQKGIKAGP